MKRATQIVAAVVLAVFATVTAQVAAQQPDTRDRTFLTFSTAVELPELTLEPGTYVFKLADTPSRNVVQVWTEDEQEMLGQWLYVQAERPEVSQETVVMFREAPEGTTPAVQYWYYPGERIGKEFMYPREQAEQIAARTGQPVITEEGDRVDARAGGDQDRPAERAEAGVAAEPQARDESGRPVGTTGVEAERRDEAGVEVETQPQTGVTRDDQVAPGAQAQQQPAPAQPQPGAQRPDVLPQTASPLPLSALIGLLSLIGAFGLRVLRR